MTWPVTVGAHASVVVPEYWRAGGPDDQKLLRALSTPGVLDDIPDLWRSLTPPDIKDHAQFAIAKKLLARAPTLMLVHAFALDDAQHDHGPWSAEAIATLEDTDRELGEFVAALPADTTLLVVSDHGFAPVDHEVALPALFAAHGLDGNDVATLSHGGTAFVYVRGKAAEVDAALATVSDRIARRMSHDEIVALGGDPDATFAIISAPGVELSDRRGGDPVADVGHKGHHGWPPDDPAMAASLIVVGPGIPHTSLGQVDMVDIAPTIARWLDVSLSGATGKPIAGLAQ